MLQKMQNDWRMPTAKSGIRDGVYQEVLRVCGSIPKPRGGKNRKFERERRSQSAGHLYKNKKEKGPRSGRDTPRRSSALLQYCHLLHVQYCSISVMYGPGELARWAYDLLGMENVLARRGEKSRQSGRRE